MKKQIKKLSLNKKTISNLTETEMSKLLVVYLWVVQRLAYAPVLVVERLDSVTLAPATKLVNTAEVFKSELSAQKN